ncbi:MAG: lysoplasmalogenase [Clostridiales bacterium]|nr:lysoplasmalogenase [Acutalibacteraceae bacterium]NLD30132.1 lysoplasmalogenase [Clostridiales bacterium]
MSVATYAFLILFFVFSGIHLFDSWKDDAAARKKTKPFLLIFLILFYVTAAQRHGGIEYHLLLALVTSWLGDVLLMPKGHHWFALGGVSFGASHVFFILVYAANIVFESMNWWIVIPVALLYFAVVFAVIFAVQPTTPKIMVGPMYIYLLANATMNSFALMQLITHRSAGAVVAYIGALLFFISDCTLFLVRYYKKNEDLIFHKHFTVMLTYLFGELLIVVGMLMQA